MGQVARCKSSFCPLKNLLYASYHAKEILDCRETNARSLAGIKVEESYHGMWFLMLYFLAALAA